MITFLANLVIPLFIFTLVLYGTLKRKDIYTPFLEGVMDGFKIVLEIAPTLIALFFAIQIFRSSGALDLIVRFLTPMGKLLKIPKEVLPVIFAKLFSSSAEIQSASSFHFSTSLIQVRKKGCRILWHPFHEANYFTNSFTFAALPTRSLK